MYHVTLTKYVRSIQKTGIQRYARPSNWVNGAKERYGEGYIFAFESRQDAMRWAAKMDWDLFTELGSGNISVVDFCPDCEIWETDGSDPMTRITYEAAWLKCKARVRADQIRGSFVVTQEDIKAMIKAPSPLTTLP